MIWQYLPILTGLGSLLFLWPAIVGFRTGEMEFPRGPILPVKRSEQPKLFWLGATLNVSLGLLCIAITIEMLVNQ